MQKRSRKIEGLMNLLKGNSYNSYALLEKEGTITLYCGDVHHLDSLEELSELVKKQSKDVVFVNPFCSIREKGYESHGDEPILALVVEFDRQFNIPEMLSELSKEKVPEIPEFEPSLSDKDYAEIAKKIQEQEIYKGNAVQVIFSRYFEASCGVLSDEQTLALYAELLKMRGQYMTLCFVDGHPDGGSRFLGASPERHLEVTHEATIMNPIAGTFRKGDPVTFLDRFVRFLIDRKEINELFQVVDEELKMMAQICPRGGSVEGPFLRDSAAVIHTEYLLRGLPAEDPVAAFRHSQHAPTLIGGPLESATRIIKKYEGASRRYYGGEIGILRADGTLDSAILIRTAEFLPDGTARVQAGAGIVRDSVPESEARETQEKAAAMLQVFSSNQTPSPTMLTPIVRSLVGPYLEIRNQGLSRFLMQAQNCEPETGLSGHRILIADAEDEFVRMVAHMIRHLGSEARIEEVAEIDPESLDADLVILGPGPGDINDAGDPRIAAMRKLTEVLLESEKPTIGLCLGHQAIAYQLGLSVEQQLICTQGMQVEVPFLDGNSYRLGFYNSFSPLKPKSPPEGVELVCSQEQRVMALKGKSFISSQFHPESIMSENGYELLAYMLRSVLPA